MEDQAQNYPDDDKEYDLKVILLGDTAVGKTSIINSIQRKENPGDTRATIHTDFSLIHMYTTLENYPFYKVALQIWDTAGQERFRSIATNYYRNSDTFEALTTWKKGFEEMTNHDLTTKFPYILVGNKSDLRNKEQKVGSTLIDNFVENKGISSYHETTITNQDSIKQLLQDIVNLGFLYQHIENRHNQEKEEEQATFEEQKSVKLQPDVQDDDDESSKCYC